MKTNQLVLWLSINRYALLLDLGASASIAFGVAAWRIFDLWWLAAVFGLLTLLFLPNAQRIHAQSQRKYRAILLLTVRNAKRWSPAGFEKYLASPCGRVVVRTVLRNIGRSSEYRNLKKAYPQRFCAPPQTSYSVTIHRPAEGYKPADASSPAGKS
jgi:hypothetical protein